MMNLMLRLIDFCLYRHALRAYKQGASIACYANDSGNTYSAQHLEYPNQAEVPKEDKFLASEESSKDRRNVYPFW